MGHVDGRFFGPRTRLGCSDQRRPGLRHLNVAQETLASRQLFLVGEPRQALNKRPGLLYANLEDSFINGFGEGTKWLRREFSDGSD